MEDKHVKPGQGHERTCTVRCTGQQRQRQRQQQQKQQQQQQQQFICMTINLYSNTKV